MLRFSKELTADILNGFECGVQTMDGFIRDSLVSLINEDRRYSLYVAVEDSLGVVALFITSSGIFIDHNSEYHDLPSGKPWGFIDDDFQMKSGIMYPTLEIDFLAVRKDLRGKGYGTQVIEELSAMARSKNCFFLTVDAYHTGVYSAIPFYEKQGFFALQEYSEEYDTLRMAKRV